MDRGIEPSIGVVRGPARLETVEGIKNPFVRLLAPRLSRDLEPEITKGRTDRAAAPQWKFCDRLLRDGELAAVKSENRVNERREAWRAMKTHKGHEKEAKGVLLMQCA